MCLDDNHDSVVLPFGEVIECLLSCDVNISIFDLSEKVAISLSNVCKAPVFRSRPEIISIFFKVASGSTVLKHLIFFLSMKILWSPFKTILSLLVKILLQVSDCRKFTHSMCDMKRLSLLETAEMLACCVQMFACCVQMLAPKSIQVYIRMLCTNANILGCKDKQSSSADQGPYATSPAVTAIEHNDSLSPVDPSVGIAALAFAAQHSQGMISEGSDQSVQPNYSTDTTSGPNKVTGLGSSPTAICGPNYAAAGLKFIAASLSSSTHLRDNISTLLNGPNQHNL